MTRTIPTLAAVAAAALGVSANASAKTRAPDMKPRAATSQTADLSAVDGGYYVDAVDAIHRRDYARALDLLQEARAHDPHDIRVLNAFGVVYDKLGRFDLSARYYAQAKALDPSSQIVAQNMQYSARMQGLVSSQQSAVALATPTVRPEIARPALAVAPPPALALAPAPAPMSRKALKTTAAVATVESAERPGPAAALASNFTARHQEAPLAVAGLALTSLQSRPAITLQAQIPDALTPAASETLAASYAGRRHAAPLTVANTPVTHAAPASSMALETATPAAFKAAPLASEALAASYAAHRHAAPLTVYNVPAAHLDAAPARTLETTTALASPTIDPTGADRLAAKFAARRDSAPLTAAANTPVSEPAAAPSVTLQTATPAAFAETAPSASATLAADYAAREGQTTLAVAGSPVARMDASPAMTLQAAPPLAFASEPAPPPASAALAADFASLRHEPSLTVAGAAVKAPESRAAMSLEAQPQLILASVEETAPAPAPVRRTAASRRREAPIALAPAPALSRMAAPAPMTVHKAPPPFMLATALVDPTLATSHVRPMLGVAHGLYIVDATGQADGAATVKTRLAQLGWKTSATRTSSPFVRRRITVIRYPEGRFAIARALARTLPVKAHMAVCLSSCRSVQLLVGADLGTWKFGPRPQHRHV